MQIIGILEDDLEGRQPAMKKVIASFGNKFVPVFHDNAPDFVAWLKENGEPIALLSLDHDLGPTRERDGERFDPGSGLDVIEVLEPLEPKFPIIVHSSNPAYAPIMVVRLELKGWTIERVVPFMDEWISVTWDQKARDYLGLGRKASN